MKENEPLKIYVAGPYSPIVRDASQLEIHSAIQQATHNVDRAIRIGLALIAKGHYPFIPHLSHYIHTNPACEVDLGYWYYEYDNTFLRDWADALFYIAPSKGADAELALAKRLGLKIFYNLNEVPEVIR